MKTFFICLVLIGSNALYSIPFTWGTEQHLSTNLPSDVEHSIAIDADGNALLVWSDSSNNNLLVAQFTAATNMWSTPEVIATGASASIGQNAAIAVGSSVDEAAVIYGNSTNSFAYVISRTGGAWEASPGTFVSLGSTSLQGYLRIAMNSSNELSISWLGFSSSTGTDILLARRRGSDGTTWDPDTSLNADFVSVSTDDLLNSDMVMNEAGQMAAVWKLNNVPAHIYGRQFTPTSFPSGNWTPALGSQGTQLSTLTSATQPRVGINGAGDLYSLFLQSGLQARRIVGGTAQSLVTLETDSTDFPSLSVNPTGKALAGWESTTSSEVRSSYFDGSSWSSKTTISTNSQIPAVGIDAFGNGIIVFNQTANQDIEVANFVDGAWTTPIQVISSSTITSMFPTTATAVTGSASSNSITSAGVAAWGDGSDLYSNAGLGASSGPSSPTSISGIQTQNIFGGISELYNIIQWGASPSADVASYQILRDGSLIATVSSSKTSYKDHDRAKHQRYTYEVIAVDSTGGESDPLTVTVTPLKYPID